MFYAKHSLYLYLKHNWFYVECQWSVFGGERYQEKSHLVLKCVFFANRNVLVKLYLRSKPTSTVAWAWSIIFVLLFQLVHVGITLTSGKSIPLLAQIEKKEKNVSLRILCMTYVCHIQLVETITCWKLTKHKETKTGDCVCKIC